MLSRRDVLKLGAGAVVAWPLQNVQGATMGIALVASEQVPYAFAEQGLRPGHIPNALKARRIIGWNAQALAPAGTSGMLHLPPIMLGKRALIDRIDLAANVTSASGPVNHAVNFNVWTNIIGGTPNLTRLYSMPLHAVLNPSSANTYVEERRVYLEKTENNLWLPMTAADPINLTIEFPEVVGVDITVWWNGMLFCWSEP